MPYKKKRMSKRSTRNYKRRRFNISRPKPYQTKFVRLTRWSNNDTTNNCHLTWTGSNTTPSGVGNATFRLDQCAGFSEIVALFDNYRIAYCMYRFVITRDPAVLGAAGSTGVGQFPRLTWVHDFNDSTPITRAQMMQHPKMREFYFSESKQKTRWFKIRPASLTQVFEGTATTAYKPSWGQFVDTNDSGMNHYGLKVTWDQLYNTNNLLLEVKMVFDCKGIS